MKDLCAITDLDRAGIEDLLELADAFADVNRREIPKVPALRGRTVVSVFFEDSTRTRLSFETAAKRLSADTMTFGVSTSSVNKGESLLDTIQTIDAMGVDAMVVRHRAAGTPLRIAGWTNAHVINAGDGRHEHPTQALLDAYTLRSHRGANLSGLRVGIVGDIAHSRVARSNAYALTVLGCEVTLIAPPTLMPESLAGWPVQQTSFDLDAVIEDLDVIYVLRLQLERQGQALLPSLREYSDRYGLTVERVARCKPDALVMHPGPMNRGVEIATAVADSPRSLITEQVANGVSVRMAVLYRLLGAAAPIDSGAAAPIDSGAAAPTDGRAGE